MTSHFWDVDCYQSGSFEDSSYSRKDRRVPRTRQHPSRLFAFELPMQNVELFRASGAGQDGK